MQNCVLCAPNYIDLTFYTVAFSGGDWQKPLTNMEIPELSVVARSVDLDPENTQFDVDLGVLRDVRAFVIPVHNLSTTATIRWQFSTVPDFDTVVLDTGFVDVFPEIYEFGTLYYGHPSFYTGRMSEEERRTSEPVPAFYFAPAPLVGRYVRVEIIDASNPDGYVDLTRLFIAPGYQPTKNIAYGFRIGQDTDTQVSSSAGSARSYDERKVYRRAELDLKNLPVNEALAWPQMIQRTLGISKQLFFIFDPDDTANLHRRSFLANISQLTDLDYPYMGINNAKFLLEEVVA